MTRSRVGLDVGLKFLSFFGGNVRVFDNFNALQDGFDVVHESHAGEDQCFAEKSFGVVRGEGETLGYVTQSGTVVSHLQTARSSVEP